jgi:hypothetical protein
MHLIACYDDDICLGFSLSLSLSLSLSHTHTHTHTKVKGSKVSAPRTLVGRSTL